MIKIRIGSWTGNVSRFLILVVLLFLGSCDSSEENLAGPCYHEFLSPVLVIESATIVGSNEPIESLKIISVSRDGYSMKLGDLVHSPSFGVSLEDGFLACEVPCGFGFSSGHYSLEISANGMLSVTMDVDADYARNWGTCPSFSEGATVVSVSLSEE